MAKREPPGGPTAASAARSSADTAALADENGSELSVLMYPDSTDSNPYQRELRDGLQSHGVAVEMSGYGQYVSLLPAVREHGRPDVVHLHWLSKSFVTEQSWLTALLGVRLLVELLVLRLSGVRVVWTVHNLGEHARRSPRVELLTKRLATRLIDGIIVHCDGARGTVMELFDLSADDRPDVRAVPHGNYLDSYPNEIDRADARADLGYGPEDTVFLYFGLIRPYKNVPELVDTFRELDAPDARLLVVGNPWSDELAATVRDRVAADDRARAVLEFVPDDEIQRYMNAADAVVLPYEEVLTSGAAILAMSFGNPVVAPNRGCVGERLDPRWNVRYDPDETDGLRAALADALDADLRTMGEGNYEASTRLDWSDLSLRTRRLYSSICN
ncbi:glycosyltransferase [Halobellus sp. Atlit-38R]|uniref:glycosyltransferase n=1 Tax=Halobellus sp. Atlit-38R TaxID=2282131 RepID=UPI000EF2048C|nr:glycosyltransferase [Halobellus sp. Atlit-38R]RLM89194.1 glycosyltransferase [Halobellus sp. Atlit-38R]